MIGINFLSQLFIFTLDTSGCVYDDTYRDGHFDIYLTKYVPVEAQKKRKKTEFSVRFCVVHKKPV